MPFRNGLRGFSLILGGSTGLGGGPREACRVKTDAPLAGYIAAGSGVGKTLTSPTDALAHNTIDVVVVALNDRVLVSQQGGGDSTPDPDNGIYEVTQLANGAGLPLILTRATDADEDPEVTASINLFVSEGLAWKDTGWELLTNNPIVVDTTPLQFTQFAGSAGLALTSSPPVDVTKAAAAVGVATTAARSDHKHDIATAVPSAVGTANSEGASSSLARADHVHDHGTQALGAGTQHAVATTLIAGFESAADKTKLDGIATGATNTPLTAAAPVNVTKAAAVVGVSTDAARSDHKHDIDTAIPSTIGILNAEGASTSLARADHVHSHGAQVGGILHDSATIVSAGFISAADKSKLDGIASGAAALTGVAPVDVTKAAAVVGVATDAARADHKHDISTAVAADVGTASAEGAATSLSRSDHVHRSPRPVTGNKNMVASVTVADNDLATVTAVVSANALGGYIGVRVNGVHYVVGDGTKVGVDCYLSGDGGVTARAMAAVVAADTLHWNGSVGGFQLAATDRIDIDMEAF